ncbi:putative poly(3-hydroxyalkanoate) depolymerase [Corynebacterium renale]|uniref:Polyhydroxybutyrate depolymerase n=1 Tax=Corynebacterium renale TaxID=1724 RepID=A0A2A9DPB0_9CORY|nr:hypothetical protein [Corynebacterium renale]PFG28015.1 polyhydroxybutyrate depolymerase [Corynebacterium renale]SQG65398.1 putative poly(3-hydroxyalkanoate) depolymerase [Corynebacterium renale]SQI21345.1 putative poly(3-hydroxyalkanoate) depolymerase [Corynebacterium renale]STC99192.1 putative poly(3-hydroxyalkanoate) depolymerase [Corynebacterium renale]
MFATIAGRRVLVAGEESDTLIIVLHGSKQSGPSMRVFTGRHFEYPGVRTVYPDGVENHWNDCRATLPEATRAAETDDVGFLQGLATHFGARRVFLVGFSNGGHMVWRVLRDAPGFATAAAVLSAPLATADNLLPGAGWEPTPVLIMHGDADPIVPYSGGRAHTRGTVLSVGETAATVAAWNNAKAPVTVYTMAGAGHVIGGTRPSLSTLGAHAPDVDAGAIVGQFFAHAAGAQTH